MDLSTELTCPECGEQQTQAEVCVSCGENLLSAENEIPTIQGKTTVSKSWPTQSSPKPASTESPVKSEEVLTQSLNTIIDPLPTETHITIKSTEESQTNQNQSKTINWQHLDDGQSPQPVVTPSETTTPQTVALPWNAIPSQQEEEQVKPLLPVEQTETISPTDSVSTEQQTVEEPPTPQPISTQTSASLDRARHPVFRGTGQSLFGIFIVNTFLTLITLGIYSFWGRARVRQFLNSQTNFAGSRFSYHGTGKELFTGWMKAMLVFGLPYLSLSLLPFFWQGIPAYIPQAVAGLLVLIFLPVAVVGAHRYRLGRTALRNIRFSFRGTVSDYTKLWLKGSALTVLTLGGYYPFFENARRHYLVTHSQFGNQEFHYDGTGKDLLTIYSKAVGLFLATILLVGGALVTVNSVFLSLPMTEIKTILLTSSLFPLVIFIALIPPWMYIQAARQRFYWNHTSFGDARFHSTVPAWKLFELRLGHLILLIATFGLAWPWVQIRNLQFFYYYTSLHGPIHLHRIEQDALDASPTGEELAGFFDTGFDLG